MDACLSLPMPMSDAAPPRAIPADDDAGLVQRAVAGETAAFEALYRRHVARVHGVLWRLSGMHAALAEELTQEAFLHAWQGLPGFRGDSAFSTWLHRLAVNLALMRMRTPEREETVDPDTLVLLAGGAREFCAGERAELEQAVARLPPRARAVLVLHDIEGWRHQEIGAALGIASGSCKAHLHRARGLLRALLGEPGATLHDDTGVRGDD